MRWIEVQYREGGGGGWGRVFIEKVYRSSKWWEVKDWGEIVSELMIVKIKQLQETCLGIFTFCTCSKILICLVCFFASFKLSFV